MEDDRSPPYGFPGLARLTGVSVRAARSFARRLVSAGLSEWSGSAVEFPNQDHLVTIPDLVDSFGGGRGSLAIPRRMHRITRQGSQSRL